MKALSSFSSQLDLVTSHLNCLAGGDGRQPALSGRVVGDPTGVCIHRLQLHRSPPVTGAFGGGEATGPGRPEVPALEQAVGPQHQVTRLHRPRHVVILTPNWNPVPIAIPIRFRAAGQTSVARTGPARAIPCRTSQARSLEAATRAGCRPRV